jgi:hypothetical protein
MTITRTVASADQSLVELIPEPSRVRNVFVMAAALLALVATACLGAAARLDLRPSAGGADLLPNGRVAYAVNFEGRVFPGTRVTDFRPPEGTRSMAVWLLGPDDPHPLSSATTIASAVSAMEASGIPGILPQSVPSSGLRLLVVLQVDDCAAISDGAPEGTEAQPPIIEVSSGVGSVNQVDLDFFSWPRLDLDAEGVCD